MSLRIKTRVMSIGRAFSGVSQIGFFAVGSDDNTHAENATFASKFPGGAVTLFISDAAQAKLFAIGDYYYVDLTKAS